MAGVEGAEAFEETPMKLLAFNDLHLASVAPESRIDDDFPEELFELLDQIAKLAIHLKVDAICIAGDIFHVRSRCSLAMLARLGEWCQRLEDHGIRRLTIPGNHDLKHDRYETLDLYELGLFYTLGLMENVSVTRGCEPARFYCENDEQGRHQEIVEVVGVPFPDAFAREKWAEVGAMRKGADVRVIMGHCFAAPVAGEYWGEPVHAYADLLALSKSDVIIFGHDHTDRGAYAADGKIICDLGAISRGSIGADDVGREIKVAFIDTFLQTVQQIRLAYRPATTIFDLAKKETHDAEVRQVRAYVQQLAGDLLTQGADPSLTFAARLQGMNVPREILERTLAYIESAEQAGK